MRRAKLDPHRPFQRFPLAPHQMRDRQTRTEDVFVLCHLGVVHVESTEWSLSIDGLVERPRTLRFDDLLRYPKTEVTSVQQCCGSPFAPFEPTGRVSNLSWGGARLADVLADSRPRPAAGYLWSPGPEAPGSRAAHLARGERAWSPPAHRGTAQCRPRRRRERRLGSDRASYPKRAFPRAPRIQT
jgi:DMSO/TMAO reductase YedYZ molybdopterin-dependent catalytic subunit